MKRIMLRYPLGFVAMFTLIVFTSVTLSLFTAVIVLNLLILCGWRITPSPWLVLLIVSIICVLSSTFMARVLGKRVFAPVRQLSQAAQEVAKGDFSVKIKLNSRILEIAEMERSFNIMTRELASTEIIHSDFTRNVSHEFKTPLTAIEGYAALLQNKSLSPERQQEYVAKIIANTRRLTSLTSNILKLSRLENKELPLEVAPFRLDEQIRQAVLLYEMQWEKKQLQFDMQLPELMCTGNEDLLFEVWQNLLGNAVKFADPNTVISVQAAIGKMELIVSIANQGPEIAAEDQARIFEKFYQCEQSHHDAGNGLGLALVREITTLHHGRVEVHSENGLTVFSVILPQQQA